MNRKYKTTILFGALENCGGIIAAIGKMKETTWQIRL